MNVTLDGKEDFVEVTKIILDYLGGPNAIVVSIAMKEWSWMVREGDRIMEENTGVMPLLTGRTDPRNVVISRAGKAKKQILLQPPGGVLLCWHLDFSFKNPFWTSDLQICRMINLCCLKALNLQQQQGTNTYTLGQSAKPINLFSG